MGSGSFARALLTRIQGRQLLDPPDAGREDFAVSFDVLAGYWLRNKSSTIIGFHAKATK
jgi:hypothetical protein